MFGFIKSRPDVTSPMLASQLYDQSTFYKAFLRDLSGCTREVIIECPFMTTKRVMMLLPTLKKLTQRGVIVIINTRDPEEHEGIYKLQAYEAVTDLQTLGATVLYTAGHHCKLAILDRTVIWEGSLNILSQNDSCEIMRKITSTTLAQQMIDFLRLEKYLGGRKW